MTTTPASYHRYAVEWTSSSITWFIDNNQYASFSYSSGANSAAAFQHPFYLILNLAIGGDWPGNMVGTLPAQFSVDYVRVYSTALVLLPSIGLKYGKLFAAISLTGIKGKTISFKCAVNNFYVQSNHGAYIAAANATANWPNSDCTWTVGAGSTVGTVSLASASNGQYLSTTAQPMWVSAKAVTSTESFKWVSSGNGFFSLQCANGLYMTAGGVWGLWCGDSGVTSSSQFYYG